MSLIQLGFPGGSDGKESASNVGDLGSIPPGGGHGNPLQYSYLENPHGQRSLVGYSPWGRKELDATEHIKNKNKTLPQKPTAILSANSVPQDLQANFSIIPIILWISSLSYVHVFFSSETKF